MVLRVTRTPFRFLPIVTLLTAFSLLGLSCASRRPVPPPASASEAVPDPGRPAQPEKPKPPEPAAARLARTSALAVVTETAAGAGRIHLQPVEGDRDTLIEDAVLVPHPAFAPDGSRFAYLHPGADTLLDVALFDLKSRKTSLVQDAVYQGEDVELAWNPAGTRYVVRRLQFGRTDAHLLLFHYDGTGEQRLIAEDAAFSEVQPAFSPDGQRLAFRRVPAESAALQDADRIPSGDLQIYRLDTGAATTPLKDVQAFAWLDATHIVVLRALDAVTGRAPLELLVVDGENITRLAEDALAFAVSGDRSRIVFTYGNVKDGYEVLLLDPKKPNDVVRLSSFSDEPLRQQPSLLTISENGQRIGALLVSSSRAPSAARRAGQVLFVDFKDKLVRRFADQAFASALSPDGDWIAYETDEASAVARAAGVPAFSTVWMRKTSGNVEPRRVTSEEDRAAHHAGWIVR